MFSQYQITFVSDLWLWINHSEGQFLSSNLGITYTEVFEVDAHFRGSEYRCTLRASPRRRWGKLRVPCSDLRLVHVSWIQAQKTQAFYLYKNRRAKSCSEASTHVSLSSLCPPSPTSRTHPFLLPNCKDQKLEGRSGDEVKLEGN